MESCVRFDFIWITKFTKRALSQIGFFAAENHKKVDGQSCSNSRWRTTEFSNLLWANFMSFRWSISVLWIVQMKTLVLIFRLLEHLCVKIWKQQYSNHKECILDTLGINLILINFEFVQYLYVNWTLKATTPNLYFTPIASKGPAWASINEVTYIELWPMPSSWARLPVRWSGPTVN